MRIFFTGVSGLLGINFALEAHKNHDVLGVYNQQAIASQFFTSQQMDLFSTAQLDNFFSTWKPDWIVHCAALADVNQCEKDPDLAERINVHLSRELALRAQQHRIRLLYISTDSVFDGKKQDYVETDSTSPINVYGKSKLKGEHEVLSVCDQALIARVNFFGWSVSGTRSLAEWVIKNLRANNPIQGYTDVYFSPLLANSLARVLLQMMDLSLTGIYHVTGNDCLTKYEFAHSLAKTFELDETLIEPSHIVDVKAQAMRPLSLRLSNEKLRAVLPQSIPSIQDDIRQFHALEQNGYTQQIRSLLRRE